MKPAQLIAGLCTVAAAMASGCGQGESASESTGSGGSTSTGTGASSGCATSACVTALPTTVSYAVEIDPADSSTVALTELPIVDLGPLAVTLGAQAPMSVLATFSASSPGALPATAEAVLSFPPLIGGRPDLSYQSPATLDATTTLSSATLSVPGAANGRENATLTLVPLPSSDQTSPPYAFSVVVSTPLAETNVTDGQLMMSGTLQSAIGGPPASTFVARAFLQGAEVSSAPLTDASGAFNLALPASEAGTMVTVELVPQNSNSPDPWWVSMLMSAGTNLGPIMLPAYSVPNVFGLTVQGSDNDSPVSGALVRAQTVISQPNAIGTTDYARAGTTNAMGTVNLSLLPGTATAALDYEITVIPPAGSPYATRCVPNVAITVGGNTSGTNIVQNLGLAVRPVLTGTVTSAGGSPQANVAITATAGPAPTDTCQNTPAVSSNTLTDANGAFTLPLDPGTYQLDFDPPAGAAVPRLTETAVAIAALAGPIQHDVTLQPGGAVRGTVIGPDGNPVPDATVRIFQVQCDGTEDDCFGPNRTPPLLLGLTTSDASGSFVAVIPQPGS